MKADFDSFSDLSSTNASKMLTSPYKNCSDSAVCAQRNNLTLALSNACCHRQPKRKLTKKSQLSCDSCEKNRRQHYSTPSQLQRSNDGVVHRAAIISHDYAADTASMAAAFNDLNNGSSTSMSSNFTEDSFQNCTAFVIDEPDKAYAQYLQARLVYEVIPVNTKFVVLDTNLSVRKAFYALIYNGVRSALLWSSDDQRFCGLLTVTDFINILILTYENSPDRKVQNIEDQLIKEWRELLSRQNNVKPLLSVSVNDTLLNATKLLIDGRFHRIPIFDDTGANALHFLTHKRILRYLYLVMDQLPTPSFMTSTPRSLEVGTYDDVLTVDQRTPLIDCLRRLTSRNISALPVLNQSGVVVDIYARFDAISLAADTAYHTLDQPVGEVLSRRKKMKWYKGVVTCRETDTLKAVVDKLYKADVHGLVVVDKQCKLIGIITLYDVLKFMIVGQMDEAIKQNKIIKLN